MVTPVIINPVNDVTVQSNAQGTILNLFNHFDDPATTGQIARFQLYNSSLGNGVINIVLFDQANVGAPLTVQNFLNYVNDGDYVNTIIHRSVPGFVIQGGGFKVEQFIPSVIPTNPPVQNEFSPIRSNLRGTIAMAKVGGNPNSATNQWFFNLANNSGPPNNLDSQNGGFTVFGQALSNTDLVTIDAIAALRVFNGSSVNPAFSQLPLLIDTGSQFDSDDDYARFSSITTFRDEELQFTVTANSNPTLVNPTIAGREIRLDYFPNQAGTAEITIAATNLLGERIEDTFTVTVTGVIDPAQYGASHPDLIRAFGYNLEALTQHYFNNGRTEGRSTDNFGEFRYIASHLDLINAFGTNGAAATEHYIRNGFNEGRSLTAFDAPRYLASYEDLRNAFGLDLEAASKHYITNGLGENRNPNLFPSERYIASHDDLIRAFGYNLQAGTNHYLFNGLSEERDPLIFNPANYLASNRDLINYVNQTYANPANGSFENNYGAVLEFATFHFITAGLGEGRSRGTFDPIAYFNRHADLSNAFGNDTELALRHYSEFGAEESRPIM